MTIEGAAGIPLTSLRQTVLECEKILHDEVPEVESALFQFGAQESWSPGGSSGNSINVTVKLVPIEERQRSQFEIQDVIRKRLDDIPGITYSMQSSGGGPMSSGENDIEVKIIGHDLDVAQAIAEKIKTKMTTIKGLVDIQMNMKEKVPQLAVHLNQDVLNDYGLSYIQVASMVSTAIQGRTAAQYREGGDEYDIYVQLDEKFRNDRSALDELMIPLPSSGFVPLKQLGQVEETLSPQTIYRENQERYITVGCNLSGIDLSSATSEVKKILSEVTIPSDFTVLLGGSAEDQQESYFYLMLAFLVAVVLVYMVMASQFESLVDPFIIMFTVPLSIIGVLIFLFITGTSLSVMALVGVVMLVGIAVNNGILLVDITNQLRRKGESLYTAVEIGGVTRLRPVLMTALTTIFGMMPLALQLGSGSETWMPLARTVIGGLTMATILTLIVIPVLYIIFEESSGKLKNKLSHRTD
jgi:HAE1 family hydrophobic/amphiphilic exporter-1